MVWAQDRSISQLEEGGIVKPLSDDYRGFWEVYGLMVIILVRKYDWQFDSEHLLKLSCLMNVRLHPLGVRRLLKLVSSKLVSIEAFANVSSVSKLCWSVELPS